MNERAEIVVRFATLADQDLVSRYNYIARVAGAERVHRMIMMQQVVVAEQAAQPMGYAYLDFLGVVNPFLAMIWVFDPFRRQGVGRALLTFIEVYIRGLGHTVLYSSTQASEPEPQAWHRHMGFEECGFIAGAQPSGIGEVYFRKYSPEHATRC